MSAIVLHNAKASSAVIPAERPGLCPGSESRNPVLRTGSMITSAWGYWVPARASPAEPGSLGRDDSSYAIAPPFRGREHAESAASRGATA